MISDGSRGAKASDRVHNKIREAGGRRGGELGGGGGGRRKISFFMDPVIHFLPRFFY